MASGKRQVLDFAILNHDDRLFASIVRSHLEDVRFEPARSPLGKQGDLATVGGVKETPVLLDVPGAQPAKQALAASWHG